MNYDDQDEDDLAIVRGIVNCLKITFWFCFIVWGLVTLWRTYG